MRCASGTLAVVVAAAALAVAPGGAAAGFELGISDDAPKWLGDEAAAPIAALGAQSVRLTLAWEPGARTLDDTQRGELELGTSSVEGRGLRVVLAVFADRGVKAPVDAAARDDYCAFVRSALELAPRVREVVIWNEPNSRRFWRPQFDDGGRSAAPAAYAALLARCYDVLHAFRPGVEIIGLATAPRGDDVRDHSPGAFVRGVGAAYRASFRMRPLFDTVSHHVYGDTYGERPWHRHPDSPTIAQGDWNKLMWALAEAFEHTAQPLPGECAGGRCVSIRYLEAGFQTTVPAAARASYVGEEPSTDTIAAWAGGPLADARGLDSPAPDQATQLVDAVRLAHCQPYVTALHNFLAFDEARLQGWQSGVLAADWTGKPSLFTLLDVVAELRAGRVDCDALPGGRPSADFRPPPAPPSPPLAEVHAAPFEVRLSWAEVGEARAYRVYRDGRLVGSTGEPSFADRDARPGGDYVYAVAAEDEAGNVSDRSPETRLGVPAP